MNQESVGMREIDALKEAIVSRVNHELRTPVAVAAMAFDMLSTGAGDPQTEERCREMLGRALGRMQAHLRDLNLLSSGRLEERLTLVETDLAALVKEAAASVEPLAREHGVRKTLTFSGSPRALRLDHDLARVVFRNLFDNAVRFNRPGGRVEVSVSFLATSVRVSIKDDGIGISAYDLERAMSGFHQAEYFLTRREGGLGVGLAVARRIVEAHGGGLMASSRLGLGSDFVITLPEARHEQ